MPRCLSYDGTDDRADAVCVEMDDAPALDEEGAVAPKPVPGPRPIANTSIKELLYLTTKQNASDLHIAV